MTPADVQATFCATLVDEWIRRGVRHAVIAPGSRSTPIVLALADRLPSVHVVHDERVAAFVALGLGLSGTPPVLVSTSGTAAVNFHPAVVEAGMSNVPMLVVTADRPPELRGVGAPQTIDQTHLYGPSVRWFHDPGVADERSAPTWRSLARRAVEAAADGPVHLNLPFREPLLGTAAPLPPPLGATASPASASSEPIPAELAGLVRRRRGLILAGGRSGVPASDIDALAAATGWPVLADPMSGCRHLATAVTAFDALLRVDDFAATHEPDVVVRVGRPAASKVLATWVAGLDAPLIQIGGPGVIDPDHRVAVAAPPSIVAALARSADGPPNSGWIDDWVAASERAESSIGAVLDEHPLSEPAVARAVAEHLPADARLVVASSMPVRDLEWYGGPNARAHANRGANGIDGVVSTALGLALGGDPVVAIVGDIAAVHDSGALTALPRRRADLRIVVIDNDGGGIFSFLPQAGELPAQRFEQLFGTPHGTDIVGLAAAHHIDAATATTAADLVKRINEPGPSLTRVATDRADNVAVHAAIHAAVAATL